MYTDLEEEHMVGGSSKKITCSALIPPPLFSSELCFYSCALAHVLNSFTGFNLRGKTIFSKMSCIMESASAFLAAVVSWERGLKDPSLQDTYLQKC